jgi:hypothetical protein
MRNFRKSHDDRSLLAPRQISTPHEPTITTCKRPVTASLLIATEILETHLTHSKQIRKYSLIATFSTLFAVRTASARERFTRHDSRNTNRAIPNRHTPGFRKSANPWKQTRNDFLTATKTPVSENIGTRRQRDCGVFVAAGDAKSSSRLASDSGSSASRCM